MFVYGHSHPACSASLALYSVVNWWTWPWKQNHASYYNAETCRERINSMLWWMIVIYIWLFYHGVSSPTLCKPRWRHMCPSTDRIQCPTVHLHTPPHGLHILCYLQQAVRNQSYTGLHAGIELQVSNYDAFFWHIIKFTNNWVTLLLQLAYECIVFQLVGILYSMQTVDSIPRDSEFPTLNGILCCNIERRSLIFFFKYCTFCRSLLLAYLQRLRHQLPRVHVSYCWEL